MSLLSSLLPTANPPSNTLPLAKEVAWDFVANAPIWQGGNPVFVSGKQAVLVWAWNALHTARGAFDIFSAHFGHGFTDLVGMPYTAEIRLTEAERILRETLLENPYITGVDGVVVSCEESQLSMSCTIKTIYGEEYCHGSIAV